MLSNSKINFDENIYTKTTNKFLEKYNLLSKTLNSEVMNSNDIDYSTIKELSFLNIQPNCLIEFVGENGTGKSQFILWISYLVSNMYNNIFHNSKFKSDYNILFIDTSKNNNSEERIKYLITNNINDPQQRVEVFKRIKMFYKYDLLSFETLMTFLEDYIETNNIKFIIIDSFADITYKKVIYEENNESTPNKSVIIEDNNSVNNGTFNNQIEKNNQKNKIYNFVSSKFELIRKVCNNYSITAIIVNGVSNVLKSHKSEFKDTQIFYDKFNLIPKLGYNNSFNLDCRLFFSVDRNNNNSYTRYLEIVFSNFCKLQGMYFKIEYSGISTFKDLSN